MTGAVARLHWPAVLVAALAYYALGVPWFSPATLGPAWERAQGFVPPEGYAPSMLLYLAPLVGCLLGAVATAILARATGARSTGEAVMLGMVVAVGYSVAVAGLDAIAPVHPEPWTLLAITGSYHPVGLVVVALIVTRWPGSV